MSRVVGYVRVSTEEQAEAGVSLAAQAAKVRQYAALHELDLVDLIEDAGASAKSLDRPGVRRALALLDTGEVTGLVVAKLDRLTRSLADWSHLIERYFGGIGGRTLMSVSESIDTRTAAGRMVLNLMMTVAQWERETVVERTRAAIEHKRARSERLGTIPLGRALGPDGRTLVPCPEELRALALMRDLSGRGWTLRAIGAELDRQGFKARRGGGSWATSTIARCLQRPAPKADHLAHPTPDEDES